MFHQLISLTSIVLLFVFGACLLGYGLPAYRGSAGNERYVSVFWLILGILAIIGWAIYMFGG